MAMMYGRYDFPNNMRLGQFGMPGPMYGGMGGYGGMGPSSNGATRMRYDVDDKGDERRRYDLRLNGLDSDKSSQRGNCGRFKWEGPSFDILVSRKYSCCIILCLSCSFLPDE